ncbi:hypothetical protein HX868_04050 [Pseudomonas reactans]|nr:hypothetical protein [Pseudomonas reactans]NWA65098.1 hypothetical protein [Pseudomonas reactans]
MSKSLKAGSLTEAMHRRSRYLLAWRDQVNAARDGVALAEGWQDGVLDAISAVDVMMKDQKRGLIGRSVPQVEIDPAVEARMRSNPRFVAAFEAWVRDHLKDGMDGKVRLFDELGKGIQSLIPAVLTRSQSIPTGQLQELRALVANPAAHKPASPLTPASLEAFRAFRTKQGVSAVNIATQHTRLRKLSDYIAKTGCAPHRRVTRNWRLLSIRRGTPRVPPSRNSLASERRNTVGLSRLKQLTSERKEASAKH